MLYVNDLTRSTCISERRIYDEIVSRADWEVVFGTFLVGSVGEVNWFHFFVCFFAAFVQVHFMN